MALDHSRGMRCKARSTGYERVQASRPMQCDGVGKLQDLAPRRSITTSPLRGGEASRGAWGLMGMFRLSRSPSRLSTAWMWHLEGDPRPQSQAQGATSREPFFASSSASAQPRCYRLGPPRQLRDGIALPLGHGRRRVAAANRVRRLQQPGPGQLTRSRWKLPCVRGGCVEVEAEPPSPPALAVDWAPARAQRDDGTRRRHDDGTTTAKSCLLEALRPLSGPNCVGARCASTGAERPVCPVVVAALQPPPFPADPALRIALPPRPASRSTASAHSLGRLEGSTDSLLVRRTLPRSSPKVASALRLRWQPSGGDLAFNLSPSHPPPVGAGVFVSLPQALPASNDPHEIHAPTSSPKQRQQQTTPDPIERLSSPTSSIRHSLRRTPRFETTPSPEPRVHIAAASVGFSPSVTSSEHHRQVSSSVTGLEASLFDEGKDRETRHRRRGSQDLNEDHDQEFPDRPYSRHNPTSSSSAHRDRLEPHPAVRISKNTHSAILYALEEALRHPQVFTPDVVEESASMADLMAVSTAPAASNGNGLPSPRRPTAGPAPTGSPSGIRGPRMIMQERAAREARQRAEAEKQALERDRAEQEARLLEEAQRRNADRRSAGVAAGQGSGTDTRQQTDPRHQGQTTPPDTTQAPPRGSAGATAKRPSQQRPPQPAATQQTPPQTYTTAGAGQQQQQPPQEPDIGAQAGEPAAQSADVAKPRSSFPHAFERWETLSAHWEGLTSYWIRKLEQNKDDVNRDPVSTQLARQVTDLSAAGANLFHAVVELQRLRASSERKFQRWFFETRAELERAQEVNAMMEAALQKERRDRADAIRDAIDQERGTSKIQKQLTEMRKELSISKEEARRAWEELGRREQEERDRTYSLQTGQPTIVGGVQVVPMTQGGPSRHGAPRDPAGYQQEYGQGYPAEHTQAPPTQPTPPTAGSSSSGYYHPQQQQQQQQQQPAQPEVGGRRRADSEGGYSEDEHETPATTNPPSGGHEPPSTSAGGGQWTGAYSNPQDYSGQGYGTPGWDTVPRHHHPTRLSDVIEEEDERSRTSASVSRG
ncbi:uncharacterized protein TCAP_02891 [Tolypocladium capitatum]|uniref:Uncharacterized protein n=1 Tax=Tolypocladium capitatum TaxID=45235 RepID=A0A2K3QI19_9HYPO|nr:uncharacterized protein TCAP_02891 [Tolypocladium capitatum]